MNSTRDEPNGKPEEFVNDFSEIDVPAEFSAEDLGSPAFLPPAEGSARKFEAWHRPRKQYVRRNQWAASLKTLIGARSNPARIKYLGLPGVDLLDLRYIHDTICVDQKLILEFLGFDTDAGSLTDSGMALPVSMQEVKALPFVDQRSTVLPGDIRALGKANSQNYSQAFLASSFDVVNLDLCDFVLNDKPAIDFSLYSAIKNIIAMQDRNPWLLFLTTRVGRIDIDEEVWGLLLQHLAQVVRDCDDIGLRLSEMLDGRSVESLKADDIDDSQFFFWALLAFSNWIFVAAQAQAANHVNMRSAFAYRVFPSATYPDMVSLVFEFTPKIKPVVDPAGLATSGKFVDVDTCAVLNQFSNRLGRCRDIDETIVSDPDLRFSLVEESADLLALARYNKERYLEWVKDFDS